MPGSRGIQSGPAMPVYVSGGSTTNPIQVSLVANLEDWHPDTVSDVTANDSDKTFTVPANTEWQIVSIWVELASTATAGNRQMTVQFQDDTADVIGAVKAGATQAASLTRNYFFGIGLADLTSFRDTAFLMTPMVPTIMASGERVRVYDSGAVAAAADDMVVHIKIMYRTV